MIDDFTNQSKKDNKVCSLFYTKATACNVGALVKQANYTVCLCK